MEKAIKICARARVVALIMAALEVIACIIMFSETRLTKSIGAAIVWYIVAALFAGLCGIMQGMEDRAKRDKEEDARTAEFRRLIIAVKLTQKNDTHAPQAEWQQAVQPEEQPAAAQGKFDAQQTANMLRGSRK